MLVSPKAGIKRLVDNQLDGAEQTELPYQVRIENFEGPLDLLLHLIKKNEINIYDIPVALIAQQYLEYLEAMTEGAWRIDIDGQPVARVTAEDAAYAVRRKEQEHARLQRKAEYERKQKTA